jgi:hypothetical protein
MGSLMAVAGGCFACLKPLQDDEVVQFSARAMASASQCLGHKPFPPAAIDEKLIFLSSASVMQNLLLCAT